jgi:hypothetical protein
MPDMKRREFIALLGGGGLLLAVKVKRARGQQPATWRRTRADSAHLEA